MFDCDGILKNILLEDQDQDPYKHKGHDQGGNKDESQDPNQTENNQS